MDLLHERVRFCALVGGPVPGVGQVGGVLEGRDGMEEETFDFEEFDVAQWL